MDHRRLLSPTGTTLEPLEKFVYQKLKGISSQLEKQLLLVAVSGGLDSVVLVHVLNNLKSRLKFTLHVAHINHGVRGPSADSDSKFVSSLAEKLSVPESRQKLKGMNPVTGENLLRQKRYEALFKIKDRNKASFVVTAHHKDDLLETRLMRLLQGTGIHGLRAMTMLSEDRILRPFLEVTRREIENYARAKDLDWRNDATNQDTTKLRNWIRRNWLGVLRTEHPEYVDNLFNSLERLIQNNSALPETNRSLIFDRAALKEALSDAAADQLVYSYLRQHSRDRVTSRHVTEFRKQLLVKRKRFTFRLAGVDWQVDENSVRPQLRPQLRS